MACLIRSSLFVNGEDTTKYVANDAAYVATAIV